MANSFIDNFLGNLQPAELKAISRYLKNNITNADASKTMDVFRQLSSGEPVVYKNKAALNKIKSRIFEKSMEALMIDEEFITETYCEFDQVHFKVKKQLLQCKLLQQNLTKNKTEVIDHLLKNVITLSKSFEIYPVLIEALIFQKLSRGSQSDLQDSQKANTEIIFYELCYKSLNDAANLYHELIIDAAGVKSRSRSELTDFLISSVKKLTADYEKTKSKQVNYYLHIMRFALYEYKKDYEATINECKKVIKIMHENKCIYRNNRMINIYNNLSHYSVIVGKFQDAIRYSQKAKRYLIPDSLDLILAHEVEFYIHIYSNNFSKAETVISHILTYPASIIGDFRKAKYIFYKAQVLFSKGEYKESLALLSKPLEVEKDKFEWNIVLKTITILLFIELDKLTDASRSLEALRKYLERNKTDKRIKPRDHLIVKCLRELEKNDFQADPANKALSKMKLQLSAKNTKYSWEYFTPELIPFHEWLQGKVKKKK